MCKLRPWKLINLIHGQFAQCNLPLPMSFPQSGLHFSHPDMHLSESRLFIHDKLPPKQHSLQHHSEGESLPPLCTLLVLIRATEWCHSEESNMANKCNHTKQDGQQANTEHVNLLLFLLTFKKTQTHNWLHQSITHLPACSRKHALSLGTTHWCTNVPKDANRMACVKKAVLWMTFCAFKWNSSLVHTQTQQ